MKRCPFCAEEIQDDAIKCRYCNEFLDGSSPAKTKWYFSTTAIVLAILTVGPFALPLIWWHPHYKRITKVILTVGILAVTIWCYFITIDLYRDVKQQMEQIEKLGL